jgi:acetyltransferase-like isoleucine patch superfamily enzyme
MLEVRVPRESANDNEVTVVEVNYSDGDWVEIGAIVVSVEGEKAVYSIPAHRSGRVVYVVGIGDKVEVSSTVAVILDNVPADFGEIKKSYSSNAHSVVTVDAVKPDLIMTERRKKRAGRATVRTAVIGAGRGLDQVVDISLSGGSLRVVASYDDVKFGTCLTHAGVPILGKIDFDKIRSDFHDGVFDAVIVSVSTNIRFRKACFDSLVADVPFENAIHSTASVSREAFIGSGNIILAHAVVAGAARIGNNNFISAMCNIEHHCTVGSHCTFGPGVIFSGGVSVCDEVKFGTGIFVEPFHSIDSKTFIKSGSVLSGGAGTR